MTGAQTLTFSGELVVEVCWCGMHHAVPRQLRDHQMRQHNDGEKPAGIYCPLGHCWVPSGKSRVQIEREAREAVERELANTDESLRAERAAHSATKGKLTKQTKRTANGVCPCCNRSFVQLARHMKTKHPTFVDPEPD